MGVMIKRCVRCGEDKPASAFSSYRANRDGLHSYCKECFAEYMRARRQGNPALRNRERIAAAAWKLANPEKTRAGYVKSPATKARARELRATPEGRRKLAAIDAKRRAQKTGAGGSFTAAEWLEVLAEFNHRCGYCLTEGPLEMDHVQAIASGGAHSRDNIAPACSGCNKSKNRHSLLLFARRMPLNLRSAA